MEKNEQQKEVTKKKRGRPKKVVIEKEMKEEPQVEIREVIVEKKAGFNFIEVIIIMIITVLFGTLIGSMITYKTNDSSLGGVPDDLSEFVNTYQDLVDNYYDELDKEELLNAGIKGMIEYLGDPHSTYMNVIESEAFTERVEGKYVGIGTEIQYLDGIITISDPFEDGPASKAGLKTGDMILAIDGEDVQGKSLSDVSKLIKGDVGTSVSLLIKRGEDQFDVSVLREKVDITSVTSDTYTIDHHKIGYIKIDIFASNTQKQFKKVLESLEKDGIDSLIIDVRDNSGGYLTVVSEMASMFLDKSKIIYQLDTKGVKEPIYSLTKEKRTYPIAVLINKGSASASEILASALKESYGAFVVGVPSYGKGTVQKSFTLETGSTIKYTTQKWLTPDGNWIHEKGVLPTIEVEYDKTGDVDTQLQKALEVLSQE